MDGMTMSDLPTLDGADDAVQKAKGLLPWLDDPYVCDHCGQYCLAETEYVAEQAMYEDVWVCPTEDCDSRYYRDRE